MFTKLSKLLPLLIIGSFLWFSGCGSSKNAIDRAATTVDSSVVAVYAGNQITLDEFHHKYVRSVGGWKSAEDDSIAALQDFLDRYLSFRLKVKSGEDSGLRTDSSITSEIASYRTNLARPYLLDQEVLEPLIKTVFERMKLAVSASHILVQVKQNPTPEDTLAAYQKMAAIVDSIGQGADFGEIALRNSEDPSSRAEGNQGYKGNLGFFGPGQMVSEFEDMAYTTPVGGLSPIFRTRFGYHVLKVNDRKPAVPDIMVAHIMLTPKSMLPEDSVVVVQRLDSLRSAALNGQDFGELAKKYSQHQNSAPRGGLIGPINYYATQQVPETFKRAAFDLKEIGDISGVFKTSFGFHIMKLVQRRNLDDYDAIHDDLKKSVTRLPQARAAEKKLARRIRTERGEKIDTALVRQTVITPPQDSLKQVPLGASIPTSASPVTFASIGDSSFTLGQLAIYLQRTQILPSQDVKKQVVDHIDEFLDSKAIDIEASSLEGKDPEFTSIMKEFRDGLVLFKVMEDSVWNVAARDSLGLLSYYQAHADKYEYGDRTRAIAFYSNSDSLLKLVKTNLGEGKTVDAIYSQYAADSTFKFKIDTTFVAGPTKTLFDRVLSLQKGESTDVITQSGGFLLIYNDGIEPARKKTFQEAKAEVVVDYQQIVEGKFVDRLKARYNAQTYPGHVKPLSRMQSEPAATTVEPTASGTSSR